MHVYLFTFSFRKAPMGKFDVQVRRTSGRRGRDMIVLQIPSSINLDKIDRQTDSRHVTHDTFPLISIMK